MPNELPDIQLTVSAETMNVSMEIDRTWRNITFGVEKGGSYYPPYEGPYHVTPTFYWQQRLETTGKSMAEDVLVDSIRITDSANPQGGRTIVIG
jgi:hypothetical protein